MEIKSKFCSEYTFLVYLATDVKNKDELKSLCKRDDVIVLNPEYIMGYNHITISIEKAVTSKRRKQDKPIKTDVIQYTCENSRVDQCLSLHDVSKISEEHPELKTNCFIIFVNPNIKPNDLELEQKLKCSFLSIEDYSTLTDMSKIKAEFGITEQEGFNDSGIIGAVYNRLALKDLK